MILRIFEAPVTMFDIYFGPSNLEQRLSVFSIR